MEKPNVILILADDMALGDLSCLNGVRSRTPSLDRLKTESVWFSQSYSASPVCAPARADLVEIRDLSSRQPERFARMKKQWQAWSQAVGKDHAR